MKNKKIMSLVLSTGIILSSVPSLAAPGDFYLKDNPNQIKYSSLDILRNKDGEALDILKNNSKFAYESNNKMLYSYTNVLDAYKTAEGNLDALKTILEKDYTEVAVVGELRVESVSAINANKILVTFNGENAPADPIEITLDEALVDGQTKVVFVYNDIEYNAELDEPYMGEDETTAVVTNEAELKAALNNKAIETVKFGKNIEVANHTSKSSIVEVKRNVTIQGNGKSINTGFIISNNAKIGIANLKLELASNWYESETSLSNIIDIKSGSKLTADNIEINYNRVTSKSTDTYGIYINQLGELDLTNSTIEMSDSDNNPGKVTAISGRTSGTSYTPSKGIKAKITNNKFVLNGKKENVVLSVSFERILNAEVELSDNEFITANPENSYNIRLYSPEATIKEKDLLAYADTLLAEGENAHIYTSDYDSLFRGKYYEYPEMMNKVEEAKQKVTAAEESKNKNDVAEARKLVGELVEGKAKADLTTRLDNIQAEIDADQAAADKAIADLTADSFTIVGADKESATITLEDHANGVSYEFAGPDIGGAHGYKINPESVVITERYFEDDDLYFQFFVKTKKGEAKAQSKMYNVIVPGTNTLGTNRGNIVVGQTFDAAEAKVSDNMIEDLPDASDANLEDKVKIEAAEKYYNELEKEAKELVKAESKTKLEELKAKMAEIEKQNEINAAVKEAVATINLIGNPSKLTLEDEAKVKAAEDKVEAAKELGAKDSDIVNLDHLKAARAKIETLKENLTKKEEAIQAAKVALTNLPIASNITLENEAAVEAARAAYDKALELGAKEADFLNVWKLKDAEGKIAELNTAKEGAASVVDEITALPALEDLKLEDEEAVVAAREAYDELTEAQQAFVENFDDLKAAEAKIENLKDQAAKLEAATTEVVAYEALVVDAEKAVNLVTDKDAVKAAQDAFVKATNKIHAMSAGEEKVELAERLDDANQVVIAASFVNTLQTATKDLSEDTLMNANIKLTGAQGAVNAVKNNDVKAALQGLVNVEKAKITDLEAEIKLNAVMNKANAAIADLPSLADLTLEDEEAVNKVAELIDTIVNLEGNVSELDDYPKFFNAYNKLEQLKVAKEEADAAKEELTPVIGQANSILKEAVAGEEVGQYPQANYDAFKAAIEQAQAVLENEKATKAEVETAKTELKTAINTFKGSVNEAAVTIAVRAAEAAIAELPKASEIIEVTEGLEKNVNVAANLVAEAIDLGATVDEIKGLSNLYDVQRKIDELKNEEQTPPATEVNKSELKTLAGSIGDILQKPENYTTVSYNVLLAKFDSANAVLDNADATQTEVDQAKSALQTAIDSIVAISGENIDNAEDLEKALKDESITSITLANDFNAQEIVTINSETLETLVLNGTFAKDLTVNTPNADVTNNANVAGTLTIGGEVQRGFFRTLFTRAAVKSWKQNGTAEAIVVNREVNLDVSSTVKSITLNKKAEVTVTKEGKVTEQIKVTANAKDTKINNNGEIKEVEVKAETTIVSETPISANVDKGVSVTVKKDEEDTGTVVEGTGVEIQVVSYIASGEITDISDGVNFETGKFVVAKDITNFTFKDGAAEVAATFANGKWTFTTAGTSLEPNKEDKVAANKVTEAIAALPTDNNPL